MKTRLFKQVGRVWGRCAPRLWHGSVTLALAWLLLVPEALALPVVKTITGGPSSGYVDGDTANFALFNSPLGLALDPSGNLLYVADRDNNAVRRLDLAGNLTITFAAFGINQPVGVVVAQQGNVFVLNQGDGSVVEFDPFGNFLGTVANGLPQAHGLAMDGLGNLYVTVQNNTVVQIAPDSSVHTVAVVPGSSALLQGITVMESGYLAVADFGQHGIWRIHPGSGEAVALSGFRGAGDRFGSKSFAQFNQPFGIAAAAGGMLVVTDYGNHRVKVVDPVGTVTNLYGVNPSFWVTGPGTYPGWWDGSVCSGDINYNSYGCVEARLPAGITISSSGVVYTTEGYYHLIRETTATGLSGGSAGQLSLFNSPVGLALNNSGSLLYIADEGNNAVQILDLSTNVVSTFLGSEQGISKPVSLIVSSDDDLYVLNQGDGGAGSLLLFDRFGNLLRTAATGLATPTAMAMDGSGNVYITEAAGVVRRVTATGNTVYVAINEPGVSLKGIAFFDDGTLVVSDAGNHVLWQVNPATKAVTVLTGAVGVPGSTLGSARFARLNEPQQLARAAGDQVVTADFANNRMVVVGRAGSITNVLNSTNALVWFGAQGDPIDSKSARFVPMVAPAGVAVGSDGGVFAAETGFSTIRKLLGTGLGQWRPGGSSGSGTNTVISPPAISPSSGYYPMGQWITVSSANPTVYYTTDGTEPTTNSTPVVMSGNVGFIRWFNATNDLTSLRIKAFVGTNSSVTVGGQPVAANTIGTPADFNPTLVAGAGSTIVVPVIMNLQYGTRIQSYQFRVEATPVGTAPALAALEPQNIGSNDFVRLKTASRQGEVGAIGAQPYRIGTTAGLQVSAIGTNANVAFEGYAVAALLKVAIPSSARQGDRYSLTISYPSATSDGLGAPVSLTPMPSATIQVQSSSYTVGDTASPFGGWYNAGSFGNGDLDNGDVNAAFYAALGLRVPYSYTDAFNALDAYPPDANRFVGGDGQLRFLDWQLILRRSLRLDARNWARAWSVEGVLTNWAVGLSPNNSIRSLGEQPEPGSAWCRQALVGALPVGNVAPGALARVPVYVKLAGGASLAGLQFRAILTPKDGAPAVAGVPQLMSAAGMSVPSLQQSFQAGETAFGWSLGSFSFGPVSSNFLGWISFEVPATAQSGQQYLVSFANVDGAPDYNTQYELETRSAAVVVNGPAVPASLCSDEWRQAYFGSSTVPESGDASDPDADGVPNWMEFVAGTVPIDAGSKLQFRAMERRVVQGQMQVGLHWDTVPGKVYEVQTASSLRGGAWQTLGNSITGDGYPADFTDNTVGAAPRFYRLRVVP